MLLLVSSSISTLGRRHADRNIGVLFQPRFLSRVEDAPREGWLWAADNDCFQGFDTEQQARYSRMLDRVTDIPGCLFVTCPDVVGDAAATFNLYLEWGARVLRTGQPLGYVAQDGATPGNVPWPAIGALFIGGSTGFKLSPEAAALVSEAKRRRIWVHMGRVNSWRRIEYAKSLEVDSVDGTSMSMFRETHLPRFAEMAAAPTQGRLQ